MTPKFVMIPTQDGDVIINLNQVVGVNRDPETAAWSVFIFNGETATQGCTLTLEEVRDRLADADWRKK